MQAIRRQLRPSSKTLHQAARAYSASTAGPYQQTLDNLRINSETKVIFQGFTGKQGT
jgi:succinyl-CoA synthetase alpha subunit